MEIRDRIYVDVECGKGWDDLISPIVEYIEKYNEGKEKEEKIEILQIKEKFGGLRIYTTRNAPEELKDMISEAGDKSYEKCEICGSESDIGQTTGWITTCCRKCAENIAKSKNCEIKWYSRNNKKMEIIKHEK